MVQLTNGADSVCALSVPPERFDRTIDADIAGLTDATPFESDVLMGKDFLVNGKPIPGIFLTCQNVSIGTFMDFIRNIGGKIDSLPPPVPYGTQPSPAPEPLPGGPGFDEQSVSALPVGTQISFPLIGAATGNYGGPNVIGLLDTQHCWLGLPKNYPNSMIGKDVHLQVSFTTSAQDMKVSPLGIVFKNITVTGAGAQKWSSGATFECDTDERINDFESEIQDLGGKVLLPNG
jgi:hypothetical protein